jgi:signal transduction histidine kinase
VVLVFFSAATYLRYREAAWQSFDVDLRNNLDTLESELREEAREALAPAGPSDPAVPPGDPLQRAASQSLEEFRLNGLFAEIRGGPAGKTLLASLHGVPEGGSRPELEGDAWTSAARMGQTRLLAPQNGWQAVLRTVRIEGVADLVQILVAGRTAQVEETLAGIRRALLELGAAGLLLAVAVGYWLATRALRPIDVMTRQAGKMADALSSTAPHRLDVRNAGDELGRLAATFNLLLERIESSLARTKTFVADAAHELKTPVSIIRTGSELALTADRSPEQYREALQAIGAESKRLSDLVSDLTLLAEGELMEQLLERRLLDLGEIVQEVARSLGGVAEGRRVRIVIDATAGLELRGDERLLRRAVVNLLENAVKFSPEGARVAVALGRMEGRVVLRVLDEAHTLAEEERARVFERFYRSQRSRSEGIPGSGLGLAVVQWTAALHGGSARAEPRSPVGNAFILELPAAS